MTTNYANKIESDIYFAFFAFLGAPIIFLSAEYLNNNILLTLLILKKEKLILSQNLFSSKVRKIVKKIVKNQR